MPALRLRLLGLLPDAQSRPSGAIPDDETALALALSRARRLSAGFVNARARQTGHLFEGRFGSIALDGDHLMAAARCVALNPVRARLIEHTQDWPIRACARIFRPATTGSSTCGRSSTGRRT